MTAPATTDETAPLHVVSYELTPQLVDEAASALAGPRYRNPPSFVGAVFLLGIVAFAMTPNAREHVVPLLVMFVGAVASLQLGEKWQKVQLRRLRRSGLDTAFIDKDKRRLEVRFFTDHVEVARKGESAETSLPLSGMKKPVKGPELLVLSFAGPAFVIVPQRAMSLSRFEELCSFVFDRSEKRG